MKYKVHTICAGLFVMLLSRGVWGDGGFFPVVETATAVESGDQRAILVYEDGIETVILQTAYTGAQADFAWVLPTPARARRADIKPAGSRVFDDLHWLTVPRGMTNGSTGLGCGVGCGGGASSAPGAVNVWDQFTVAGQDVVILSADASANLGGWLNENGYRVPANANEVLQSYVARNWCFVAIKLHAAQDHDSSGGGRRTELAPLQVSSPAEQPVFPLRISTLSSSPSNETSVLLYVIAAHRMATAAGAYRTREVNTRGWNGTDFRSFYAARYRQALGSPPGFAVEYVGRSDGTQPWSSELRSALPLRHPEGSYYVTRLRTSLLQGDMSEDVVFAPAAADTEFNASVGSVAVAVLDQARLKVSGIVFLGVLASTYARRRKGWWQRALLAAFLALLLL